MSLGIDRNAADRAKEDIRKLTDKERLLLLWMIADFAKGNIFYKDAPQKLRKVFTDILPRAAKYMD